MTAAIKAADKIKDKARRYAAHMLEASPDDIEIDGAEYRVKGSPDRKKTIQEIAFALDLAFDAPEGMEPYLDETAYYDTPNCTWPFGTHIAVVEIDEETGIVDLVRYVAVDDVGNKINPMIVDGQLHGGIAQGVGQALWEGAVYSDDGQLLTGSMLDYALPKASWFPNFELDETVTPSPVNPLGVKGVGEAGAIATTAAVANAVIDALEPATASATSTCPTRPRTSGGDPVREGRPGMIPAAFDYQRPATLDDGARRARGRGGSAKVLAGGKSLLPLMKLRLAQPTRSSTSADSASCKGARPTADGGFEIGALTTYAEVLDGDASSTSPATASSASATSRSATAARSAGAIAHADPASDLPALVLALDYSVVLRSKRGERDGAARRLLPGRVRRPASNPTRSSSSSTRGPLPAGATGAYKKMEHPASGYSIVGVCAVVASSGGSDHARPGRADRGGRGRLPGQGGRGRAARLRRLARRRSPRPPSTRPTA